MAAGHHPDCNASCRLLDREIEQSTAPLLYNLKELVELHCLKRTSPKINCVSVHWPLETSRYRTSELVYPKATLPGTPLQGPGVCSRTKKKRSESWIAQGSLIVQNLGSRRSYSGVTTRVFKGLETVKGSEAEHQLEHFHNPCGCVSHIPLGKSPQKVFQKGRAKVEGKWERPVLFLGFLLTMLAL